MRILLLGRDGQVGGELQRTLPAIGEVVALGRAEADLAVPERLIETVRRVGPDIIVNAAAYTAVERAESEPALARQVNAVAVEALAREAATRGAWLVHYSTDYVFDGTKRVPYVESDATNPLSVYGRTKLEGEEAVRASGARHLLFRTCWVYAIRGDNFLKKILRLASERQALDVVDDQHGCPTNAATIASATTLALGRAIEAGASLSGTYHLASMGETTWYDFAALAVSLAREAGMPIAVAPDGLRRVKSSQFPSRVVRPAYSVLDTRKLRATFRVALPDWRDGLDGVVRVIGGGS